MSSTDTPTAGAQEIGKRLGEGESDEGEDEQHGLVLASEGADHLQNDPVLYDDSGSVISRMDTESSESSVFLRAGPGERNALGIYQFRQIDKTAAPDCTVIGVVARNYIRFLRWRRGVTVSVVPYNKEPTRNIWPHIFNAGTACWGALMVITFAIWGWQMVKWLPAVASWNNVVEHGLTFTLHIVFMDLVPNWLTGLLLHRIPSLQECHRWEHDLTKGGKLASLFKVTTLYSWYTLMLMALWGLGVSGMSPGSKSWFHWESAMWIASFSYALVGLVLRVLLWLMRHYPAMYTRYPLLLKMSRFYWAHFNFREWDGGLVFGAVTPFYDVVFGTCPFDIRWSSPIPFVDFLMCDQVVFKTVRHPKRIRWSKLQWAWHAAWLAIIASLVVLLAALWQSGYFRDTQ